MVDLGLKCGYQSEEKTVGSNIDWHIKYLTAHLKRYLRTPENIASLKSLIKTDIMGSIDKNIELGNITLEDGHSFMATRKEVELISRFQRKGLYQWILRIIYKTFEINKEGMRWAFILIQVMTVLQRTRIVNCILIRQVCLNIWTELYVQMLIVSVSVMPDDLVSPMWHLIDRQKGCIFWRCAHPVVHGISGYIFIDLWVGQGSVHGWV